MKEGIYMARKRVSNNVSYDNVNVNINLYKKWNIRMYSFQYNQSFISPSNTYCFSLSL